MINSVYKSAVGHVN